MDVTFLREHFKAGMCRSEGKQSIAFFCIEGGVRKIHLSQGGGGKKSLGE